MFLTRLIYVSSITEHFSQSSIENILQVSRLNNAKNNLTGMLCFNRKYFLQCIEGERVKVNATYQKILLDNRHSDIVMLNYQEITHREFNDWSMGYIPSSSLTAAINLKYSASTEFTPYNISGKSAYKMMLELKNSAPTI